MPKNLLYGLPVVSQHRLGMLMAYVVCKRRFPVQTEFEAFVFMPRALKTGVLRRTIIGESYLRTPECLILLDTHAEFEMTFHSAEDFYKGQSAEVTFFSA